MTTQYNAKNWESEDDLNPPTLGKLIIGPDETGKFDGVVAICKVYGYGDILKRRINLIKSAPDLLNGLEAMIDVFTRLHEITVGEMDKALKEGKNAIAKANGAE